MEPDDGATLSTRMHATLSLLPKPQMVAISQGMLLAVERLVKAARIRFFSVFIHGETGVGKKEATLYLHRLSEFFHGESPFFELNCSAFPDTLLDNELFGHEKGAFTGADSQKIGQLEMANGGELVLDEIGDAGPSVQKRLLKFLEEGEILRLGGTRSIKVKSRIIASTNRDIEKEVAEGRFRRDLYYRLNIFPVRIPPLRERLEEIGLLAAHAVNKFNVRHGTAVSPVVSLDVATTLQNRSWPGNIRELVNAVERAIVIREGTGELTVSDFCFDDEAGKYARSRDFDEEPSDILEVTPGSRLADAMSAHILEALRRNNWNKAAAAKDLGISRRALYRKIESLDLPVDIRRRLKFDGEDEQESEMPE